MTHAQLIFWSVSLASLIVFSAFFSAAETALMAINRYRLRHQAKQKLRTPILILRLLKRPDRLLGLILIGNCFSNILASALATLLAVNLIGDNGVIVSTVLITLIVLVLAEVAPKTVAALYPEWVARRVAWPIFFLLKVIYPLVWLVNTLSNGLLRLFSFNVSMANPEPISHEELRSIVFETVGRTQHRYHEMLLGILDLNRVSVNDIMVPKHRVNGVDIDWDIKKIQHVVTTSPHDWLPVYRENLNQIVGMLSLRELMPIALAGGEPLTKTVLMSLLKEPYFIPENTPLNIQLMHFQRQKKRFALVVDEYGDILGLLTLADILGEIVGDLASDGSGSTLLVQQQGDGSYLVDGSLSVRELNRQTGWDLPIRGPRTISGLVIEYLEVIPRAGTCMLIHQYPVEVVYVQGNRVKVVRLFPKRTPIIPTKDSKPL